MKKVSIFLSLLLIFATAPVDAHITRNKATQMIKPILKIVGGVGLLCLSGYLVKVHADILDDPLLNNQPLKYWAKQLSLATFGTLPIGLAGIGLIAKGSYEIHKIRTNKETEEVEE